MMGNPYDALRRTKRREEVASREADIADLKSDAKLLKWMLGIPAQGDAVRQCGPLTRAKNCVQQGLENPAERRQIGATPQPTERR